MKDDAVMVDAALSIMPGNWMPAFARIAGSEDIPDLLAGIAALIAAAIPHDMVIMSCGLITRAFDNGGPTNDDVIAESAVGLTAQSITTTSASMPAVIDVSDIAFLHSQAQRRGWIEALALAIPYSDRVGATAAIYRTAAQPAFTEDALRIVDSILAICDRALSRLLDQQRTQALHSNLLGFLNDLPVGLILLDWDWTTVFVNREGYRQALHWNYAPSPPPRNVDPREAFQLPDDLWAVCNAFRNRQFGTDGTDPTDRDLPTITIQHAKRPEQRLSVTPSYPTLKPDEPPRFLVRFYGLATRVEHEFEPTAEQLKLLAQLTPAERAVALLVRKGLSNKEIAKKLHREISTVKDHLTHIFDKLAIRSRVQLARMLA